MHALFDDHGAETCAQSIAVLTAVIQQDVQQQQGAWQLRCLEKGLADRTCSAAYIMLVSLCSYDQALWPMLVSQLQCK